MQEGPSSDRCSASDALNERNNPMLHESGKSKKTKLGLLFTTCWFFSARFSLVLFLIAAVEFILWILPLCHAPGALLGPLQSVERAHLQDYFIDQMEGFRYPNLERKFLVQEQTADQQSLQKALDAEFKENQKIHSLQTQNQQGNTPRNELRVVCLFEVVLLIVGALQVKKPSSASADEAKPKTRKHLGTGAGLGFQWSVPSGVVIALLLFSSLPSSSGFHFNPILRAGPTETCDLRCWLAQLTIVIPDQYFNQTFLFSPVRASITNFQCSGITLGGIESKLLEPTGLDLDVTGVGIRCQGDWAYSWAFFSGHGSVSANVSDSSLDVTMMVRRTSDGLLINATELTVCTPNLLISGLQWEGGLTGDILQFFNTIVKDVLESTLNSVVCTELRTLVNVNLTEAMQTLDQQIKPYLQPVPPQTPPPVPQGTMNFEPPPNALINLVDYILNDVIGPNGPLGLNKLINIFTAQTGTAALSKSCAEGGLFSTQLDVPSVGSVVLGICSINIAGLNTFSEFDILEPVNGFNYSLHSEGGLQHLDFNMTFFTNVTVGNGPLRGQGLYEEGLLEASLENASLIGTMLLALNQNLFSSLQIPNDVLVPGGVCIARELWDLNITQLQFNVTVKKLALIALGGSAEKQLDDAISTIVAMFVSGFNPAIPAFLNGIIAGPLRAEANVLIKQQLQSLHNSTTEPTVTCGIPPDMPSTFGETGTISAFAGAAGAFVFSLILLLIVATVADRHRRQTSPEIEQASLLTPQYYKHIEQEAAEHASGGWAIMFSTSLVLDRRLPWYVRYSIPLFLMLNIALFISSNTSIGASVNLVLTLGDETKELPPLFSFSLSSSVRDMWEAEVYALSVLIALFSGAWPYLKLLLMLVCWVLPTKILSAKGRERFLMVLDALGKWSLIDAFVMVLMMITFRLHIEDPGHNGAVDIYVDPNVGFHTFLAATMSSLALTHIILAFHRKVKKLDLEEEEPGDALGVVNDESNDGNLDESNDTINYQYEKERETSWQPLFLHSFSRWNKVIGLLITLLLLGCMVLLIIGSIINSFRFEVQGVVGPILDFLGGSAVKDYSVIDVGLAIPESVREPNSFGVRWIQASFFVFVLGTPLTTLAVLLVLWVVPMTISLQRKVFHATEVLNAWSAMEVYLLAVAAALLEIKQFAQFIIGDNCDQINVILRQYFSDYLADPQCFGVETLLVTSFWFLLGAALIYIGTAILVIWVCHRGLERHDEASGRHKKTSIGGVSVQA